MCLRTSKYRATTNRSKSRWITGFFKMQRLFTAIHMWGGCIELAYAAQAVLIVALGLMLAHLNAVSCHG